MGDFEDGELEDVAVTAQRSEEEHALEARPRVPDPPPSPPQDPEAPMANGNKKKIKKHMEKARLTGQKVDKSLFRQIYGAEAKAKVVLSQQPKPIRANDVQALVLWVLADRKEGKTPTWAFVQNVPLIQQVVVLYVPAISASLFSSRQDLMPNLAKMGPAVPMLAKDGLTRPAYAISVLLKVPFSKEKQAYLNQTAAELEKPKQGEKAGEQPFPASYYVLKPDMMKRMGYPLPDAQEDGSMHLPDGFVETGADAGTRSQTNLIRALDCEMCETLPGMYELTRISLLDQDGKAVYDELVKPANPVTNYHTDKSGITEVLLQDVSTTLQDVQQRFLELVPAETILVGHALENDLKALKIVHMKCIDTGALYPHPKGLPFRSALRRLADRFLKRQIQQGQHDSVVDAKTALDLALLKMRHGPAFGLSTVKDFGEPLPEVLMRASKGCTLVDRPDTLNRFLTGSAHGITCGSDEEVAEKLSKEVNKAVPENHTAKFVWGQLRGVSDFWEGQYNALRQEAAAERARAELANPPANSPHSTNGAGAEAAQAGGRANANGNAQIAGTAATSTAGSKRPRESIEEGEDAVDVAPKRQHVTGAADVSSSRPQLPLQRALPTSNEQPQQGSRFALLEDNVEDALENQEMEDGEQEDSPEEAVIRQTDKHIGRIYKSLPPDTLLVVATCQGNTARTRYAQEMKMKRSQGIEKPPWTPKDEQEFTRDYLNISSQGVCFVAVK